MSPFNDKEKATIRDAARNPKTLHIAQRMAMDVEASLAEQRLHTEKVRRWMDDANGDLAALEARSQFLTETLQGRPA